MSLTSDEVNFLVYRYLLEAGECSKGPACRSHAARRRVAACWWRCLAGAPCCCACVHASSSTPLPAASLTARPSPRCRPVAAGFTHAAFVFGAESSVQKAGINGKEVPVGALVSFIQKVRPLRGAALQPRRGWAGPARRPQQLLLWHVQRSACRPA